MCHFNNLPSLRAANITAGPGSMPGTNPNGFLNIFYYIFEFYESGSFTRTFRLHLTKCAIRCSCSSTVLKITCKPTRILKSEMQCHIFLLLS